MKQVKINFNKANGLVPVIIQDYQSSDILMLAYMNQKAWQKTLATGLVWFWSRSRNKLWQKGEESGNKLQVKEILLDCDYDTILIKAKLLGKNCCHTGSKSCFAKLNISN